MTNAAARLRAMHSGPLPLVLPNVWDPVSARAFADAGFAALATSSSAMAALLGYADGATPADEMFDAIARITRSVDVPVTADVESGYGFRAAELVLRLAECGVVGCNLEDSEQATRTLTDPARHADYVAAVRSESGSELVINARVDVYVRPPTADRLRAASAGPSDSGGDAKRAADAAVARGNAYLAAGADCVYPILAPAATLPELVRRIDGPVNAMYRPGGPTLAELAAFGVARITFGGGLHAEVTRHLRDEAGALAGEVAGLAGTADL
ncbi:MAG TPA: isocitrate lyase/phosphoenolpyruvate mutase family protein [Streptosporangiaceae bacterium]|nr:isocitrate lyase/phosphoenolpyruvate mutase family protein [Streptosporangiaceae bacterium]